MRKILVIIAALTLLAPTPIAAAATPLVVESENMTWSGQYSNIADGNASGGHAVSAVSGTGTVTGPTGPIESLTVRARGADCGGQAVMRIILDGTALGDRTVTNNYADYGFTVNKPAGNHTLQITMVNPYWFFCTRMLVSDKTTLMITPPVTTTPTTTTQTTTPTTTTTTPTTTTQTTTTTTTPTTTTQTTTPTTTTTTPPAGTRTFTGDYSTGNYSQWPVVQTKNYNGSGSGYTPSYSAQIVNDSVKGNVSRYELRSGDTVAGLGGERVQSSSGSNSTAAGGKEGDTKWFQWSTKFDATWPSNHPYWCITNSFHNNSGTGSAPFHWGVGLHNGYWSLIVTEQSSPGVYVNEYPVFETPLSQGNWHDVKMQVHFSTSKTGGWVKLWLSGVPQTFMNGTDTAFFSTIVPGSTASYYKESIYRSAESFTDVLYHTGFRAATTEAGLG